MSEGNLLDQFPEDDFKEEEFFKDFTTDEEVLELSKEITFNKLPALLQRFMVQTIPTAAVMPHRDAAAKALYQLVSGAYLSGYKEGIKQQDEKD